ncbi:MAG: hypothetical protein NTV34_06420 [Proteobacteria bacterium]|nr:hypothetical protein [Pseudomonadota bacterium]
MALRDILWASGSPFYPDIYRPTYVHLDGLTVGVGLALLREHRKEIWTKILKQPGRLLLTGTALTAIGLLIFGGVSAQHSAEAAVLTYPLVSIGFGAMVASAMAPNFWLCRWRIPGASAIAALAFTLYLTHKKMIHMATMIIDQPNENPTAIVGVSLGLTIFASCLIYFGVERPFLKLRDRLLKRDLFFARSVEK